MKVFRSFEEARGIKNPVVTTGSFDGVHAGHKTILDRLKSLAAIHRGESVLVTFDPHPRKVLYPETTGKDLKLILSKKEKLHLLEKAGLDSVIIVEFTREFSRITSEEFVRDLLHGMLRARVIVVGFNHHFGLNREGDYRQLWSWQEKYDFIAEEIPEQEVQNEAVSSTRIRKALSEGNIQRANAYLDHYYIVMGRVSLFDCKGCIDLAPLFAVDYEEECKLLPSPGIYAATAEGSSECSKALAIITENSESEPLLLVKILDEYSQDENFSLRLSFHKKVHGTVNIFDRNHQTRIMDAMNEITELIY